MPDEPRWETVRVPVLKVFDGDGFLTQLGSREIGVRFGFTDAPELEQRGGKEAKAFLERLIFDRWVEIAVLTKMDTGGSFDRHGRIVCVPYICDENVIGMMRNVELEMVVNGWSWVLERYGPEESYLDALADARRHRRGIWAFDDNINPWKFKRQLYRSRAQSQPRPQLNLLAIERTADQCPRGCGGRLKIRSGRFGRFVGCTNFPSCRHTAPC